MQAPRNTMIGMATTVSDVYDLPQEHKDFRDTIRQIVDERVRPRAADIDRAGEYPWDIRKLFAEQDILALPFGEEHGGTGTGTLMLQVAVEEIARACASSALILMIQELGTLPIQMFGSDEMKERLLPRCATGEWTPAFCLSEPEAGSDAGSLRTTAVRDGDEWVINGTKNWITNASVADFYVVFARTSSSEDGRPRMSAFVVEKDRPGFSVPKLEHKLGIKGSPTGAGGGPPGEERVRRREGPAGVLGAEARAQARDQGLADRVPRLRGRARAGGEPHRRRGQGLLDGAPRVGAHPPRRGGPGGRHRAGRDRLRQPVRQGAHGVRRADPRPAGDPVQARRHGDADGRGA